jgi:hypothetical protein
MAKYEMGKYAQENKDPKSAVKKLKKKAKKKKYKYQLKRAKEAKFVEPAKAKKAKFVEPAKAKDLSKSYKYMKSLDPKSVVRESEYKKGSY